MKNQMMLLMSLMLVAPLGASQSESSSKEFYRYGNAVIIRSKDESYELRDASGEGIRKIRNLGKPEFINACKNNLVMQHDTTVSLIDLDKPMSGNPDNQTLFKMSDNCSVTAVSAGVNLFLIRHATMYHSCFGIEGSAPTHLYERSTGKFLKKFPGSYTHFRFLEPNILWAYRMERCAIREGIELIDCGVRPVRTIAHSESHYSQRINDDYALFIDAEDNQRLVVIDLALKKARRLTDRCYRLDMSSDWSSVTVFRNNGTDMSYDLASIDFTQDDSNN